MASWFTWGPRNGPQTPSVRAAPAEPWRPSVYMGPGNDPTPPTLGRSWRSRGGPLSVGAKWGSREGGLPAWGTANERGAYFLLSLLVSVAPDCGALDEPEVADE